MNACLFYNLRNPEEDSILLSLYDFEVALDETCYVTELVHIDSGLNGDGSDLVGEQSSVCDPLLSELCTEHDNFL